MNELTTIAIDFAYPGFLGDRAIQTIAIDNVKPNVENTKKSLSDSMSDCTMT